MGVGRPVGLAIGPSGRVYVAARDTGRLHQITPEE